MIGFKLTEINSEIVLAHPVKIYGTDGDDAFDYVASDAEGEEIINWMRAPAPDRRTYSLTNGELTWT